jgi:hypothetical protein
VVNTKTQISGRNVHRHDLGTTCNEHGTGDLRAQQQFLLCNAYVTLLRLNVSVPAAVPQMNVGSALPSVSYHIPSVSYHIISWFIEDIKCRLIKLCTVLWPVWPPRTIKCNEWMNSYATCQQEGWNDCCLDPGTAHCFQPCSARSCGSIHITDLSPKCLEVQVYHLISLGGWNVVISYLICPGLLTCDLATPYKTRLIFANTC